MNPLKKLEEKVRRVELNPTARKTENLIWVRYDIEDIEFGLVDEQMEHTVQSRTYQRLEKHIDKCNELYERIEDLEYKMEESA